MITDRWIVTNAWTDRWTDRWMNDVEAIPMRQPTYAEDIKLADDDRPVGEFVV